LIVVVSEYERDMGVSFEFKKSAVIGKKLQKSESVHCFEKTQSHKIQEGSMGWKEYFDGPKCSFGCQAACSENNVLLT